MKNERGSAMVAVIGVMLVVAVLSVAVLSAATAGAAFSTSSRANTQAQAAADAGVDVMYASMADGVYPCSIDSTSLPTNVASRVPASSSDLRYTAVATYKNGSTTLTCASSLVGTPTSATVTSTGTAANSGVGASAYNTRKVVATLDIVAASTATATKSLTKTIYSNGQLNLINGTSVAESASGELDGDVYSASGVSCSDAGATIAGSVTAQGDASLTNRCKVSGTVWASGVVTADGADIGGDVYSAGTGAVSLINGAHVDGSIVADGAVSLAGTATACDAGGTANVCGSVLALGGGLTQYSSSSIAGSGYANGPIYLQDPNRVMIGVNAVTKSGNLTITNPGFAGVIKGYAKVQGTVSPANSTTSVTNASGSCQYGSTAPFAKCSAAVTAYPTLVPADTFPTGVSTAGVAAPATETMPTIGNAASDTAKWTSASPAWTLVTQTSCAAAKTYIDGMTATSVGTKKILVNVTNCTTPLTWESTQFTVYNDFAVINPGGFRFYNGTNGVKSSSTTKREVSLIVPTGSTGTISTDNTTFTNVYTLLYSPETISMQNALNGFSGQIYAKNVTGPTSASTIVTHAMTVPGASGSTSSTSIPASATVTSRLDVTGS